MGCAASSGAGAAEQPVGGGGGGGNDNGTAGNGNGKHGTGKKGAKKGGADTKEELPPGHKAVRLLPNMTELLESARKPHADCVIPLLYLGNLAIARNKKSLEELRIRAVVNVTNQTPAFPKAFRYLNISVEDKAGEDLAAHLEGASEFIAARLDAGEAVLVHCEMGMSRSTTVVCAYLLRQKGWALRRAMLQVKVARPIVRVTRSFVHALLELELKLVRAGELDMEQLMEEGMSSVATGEDKLLLTASAIALLVFPTPAVVEAQLASCGLLTPEWSSYKETFLCGVDLEHMEAQKVPTVDEVADEMRLGGGSVRQICGRLGKRFPECVSPFVK